jgi:hypothetical protein
MGFLLAASTLTVALTGVAIWRAGHGVTLRDVEMVARATGSPRACFGYLRFCARSAASGTRQ